MSVQKSTFCVKYHELSSVPCFGSRCSHAYHISYECQRWSSCEVVVSPFLFDFPCNQSTRHLRSFTVTFVDVSPSTGDRFASCSHHARFICHILIGFELVIPRHFLHACFGHIFAQDCYARHLIRAISCAIDHVHTMSWSPPGSNGRLPACTVRISTSLSAILLEAPPVISDSCGAASS